MTVVTAWSAWVAVGVILVGLLGCEQAKDDPPPPVTSVAASELCAELAAIACESDTRCCTNRPTPREPADAGPSEAGVADAALGAGETCAAAQLRRCRATLGALLDDRRLAYAPTRGGKLVDALKERAKQCWSTPIRYDDVASIFAGGGVLGADCTPASTRTPDLRASSLSCSGGAACRLYLTSDGSNEAICRARAGDDTEACSHAYDCGPARFCKLPNDWKPGLWGRCQPLRADGWQCTSDRECESSFCADDARCGRRREDRICLAAGYRAIVLGDAPVAYLRLSDGAGSVASDASGTNHPGEYSGEVKRNVEGALFEGDKSIELTEGNGHVRLAIGAELSATRQLSIELWFASGESPGPLLELRSARPALRLRRSGEKGDELRASFFGPDGKAFDVATGGGKVDGGWHHVAITHDGTTGRLYLDGREVGSVASALSVDAADVLYVGHWPAIAEDPEETMRGRIDEVAVHTQALVAKRFARRLEAAEKGSVPNTFPLFSLVE